MPEFPVQPMVVTVTYHVRARTTEEAVREAVKVVDEAACQVYVWDERTLGYSVGPFYRGGLWRDELRKRLR